MSRQRKIIHIDMDAFYAAVEERDRPDLVGKPVVVGGLPNSRGVVATANYEARRYGIHSAMPASQALRLCPFAEFIRPRFDVYRDVSRQIMEILRRFSDCVEPLSLDEAYLDVTDSHHFRGSATRIAQSIKAVVLQETRLTASAGVSYNKFLAKIASGLNKPNGLTVIRPEEGPRFVHDLPVGQFYGIGKATETKMKKLGIHSGADLLRWSQNALALHFGKAGYWYALLARGEDPRPVRAHRPRKSLGTEITFAHDISDIQLLLEELERQTHEIMKKLNAHDWQAHTVTVKVRYDNFEQVTRSQSFRQAFDATQACLYVRQLLQKTEAGNRSVRLLGVTVSGLEETPETLLQPPLWQDESSKIEHDLF
ncbi:MAG: DNA polymerase IV [Burkholderiales bacterium]|jgi:DNA polymerase-4|nr:DNA polymerase IV [Burkholderiales bacterium]